MSKGKIFTQKIKVDIQKIEVIDLLGLCLEFNIDNDIKDDIQQIVNKMYERYLPTLNDDNEINILNEYDVHVTKYKILE